MNNDKIINELLEKSLSYLENTEKFLSGEVPIYVQELMSFKVFEHIMNALGSGIGGGFFIGSLISITSLVVYYLINEDNSPKFPVKSVICTLCACILFCTLFNKHTIQAYKAYSAPRVYLIDYIRGK